MKLRFSDIIQDVIPSHPSIPTSEAPPVPAALRFIDDFLGTCIEVSDGVETPADTLFANYQAFCESRQVPPVNATAFSVRVMNHYQGRGVERDEVVKSDGKLVAIYRRLAPKQQTDNRSDFFLPTETPKAGTPEPVPSSVDRPSVSERLTTPVPIKDLSRDELIICIRELESELGEPEGMIDEYWGMVDLQVWLRGLGQLKKTGRRVPVSMSAEELDYYRVKCLHSLGYAGEIESKLQASELIDRLLKEERSFV